MSIWNGYKGKGILALVLFIFYWSFYFFIGWKMENDSKILTASWYDMYFSFDQGYYILSFFLAKIPIADEVLFRHPFLNFLTEEIATVVSSLGVKNVVQGIIFFQAFLSTISVVMIYMLCCKICKNVIVSFLLAVMYGFSATMLVITWTPESFVYANFTLVLMCFVCYPFIIGEKEAKAGFSVANMLLAIGITGVTLTNSFMWFLGSVMSYKTLKKRIIWTGISIIVVVLLFALVIIENNISLIDVINTNIKFTEKQGFSEEYVGSKYILAFHLVLGSSFIFGPFSEVTLRQGEQFAQLNMLPSHTMIGWIAIVSVYAFIIVAVWKNFRKEPFVRFLSFCLLFNIVLHGIVGFGASEAFIYGAHMLFTIPLLLAYGFKVMRRVKVVALCLILILIIINNFESMLYFYHFAVSNYSL
ncbi:TPA: leucyl aminopeptidase [Bacillus cereus]|nr:leucyl aminopeptidase [Bacillus cereus]